MLSWFCLPNAWGQLFKFNSDADTMYFAGDLDQSTISMGASSDSSTGRHSSLGAKKMHTMSALDSHDPEGV